MSTNRSDYIRAYMKAYNADPTNKRRKMIWMREKRAGHPNYAVGGKRWQEIVKKFLVRP